MAPIYSFHLRFHLNPRTNESVLLFNDQSDKDANGNPTGGGLLVAKVWDGAGTLLGTYPEDGKGICGRGVDNAEFGFVPVKGDRNDSLRVVFVSGGGLVFAGSWDEGRSWSDITAQVSL